MRGKIIILMVTLFAFASSAWAGGWDKDKGMDQVKLTGQLLCLGCNLKKLNGANSQCNLYAHHAIGFKAADGTLWNIIDNEIGHDIIRGHDLLENKSATITGYMYPLAHMIEVGSISVKGVTSEEIAQAGWNEDQLIAKALLDRKVGEAPQGQSH